MTDINLMLSYVTLDPVTNVLSIIKLDVYGTEYVTMLTLTPDNTAR